MTEVVVTGLGVVSPIGNTVEDFWQNLIGGVSGVRPITLFDASDLAVRIAAEVQDFDPTRVMDRRTARRTARYVQFAVDAAKQAVADAGLVIDEANRDRIGVVLNTGGGGVTDIIHGAEKFVADGPDRVSPFLVPVLMPNAGCCQISISLGVRGPVVSSVLACASGIYAFTEARRLIQCGEADVVVTGGSESALNPLVIAALSNMGALSRRNDDPGRASRPFDRDRDGFVFGEGAAVVVLERADHARARGARCYATLSGGSLTADAHHVTAPEPSGEAAAMAITKALRSAEITPGDVDYICAHGTSTQLNDVSETRAIRRAFGCHADAVPISSPKSMVGHLLGAAGAISVVACVLAIARGVVPPTINLEAADPACDLDYVPLRAREHRVRTALANGFGFGGQNAVVVLRET